MKTFITLFLAASADAHAVGNASKADSMSYSFSDFGAKSGKSGIRYLIDSDEIESRELHSAEMSYRMFVPRAKALKSDSTKSVSAKASKNDSTKGGKSSKSVNGDMSFPLLSAKSSKITTTGVVHADGTTSEERARAKASKNDSTKSGKMLKADESDMSFPMLSSKSSKITAEYVVDSAEGAKSAKSAILFHRFLDVDISMSYPMIVPGKSVKLSPKAENENGKLSTEKSSNAAKLSTVRSVDHSDETNPNIHYAYAVDFTRMSDPSVASATVEETSSGVTIRNGLFTIFVVLVTFYSLY